MQATLILENGQTFVGTSIGSTEDRVCEMVFNTSMVGYQEILTDPSYAGQGVVMTYPLIGNYGVNEEDDESFRPWAEALIVRHLAARGSNFRCQGSLDDYLKTHNITGIENVDTRAITRILRKQGTMNGMITCAENTTWTKCSRRSRPTGWRALSRRCPSRPRKRTPASPAAPATRSPCTTSAKSGT